MQSKIFSYKVEGIKLEDHNEQLKISKSFDRKQVIEDLKALFSTDNYKVDETSLSFKLTDGQLFIQGMVVENEEHATVGFRTGKNQ